MKKVIEKKKIYFFASFGDFQKTPTGGGQTAARKLLSLLQNIGFDVYVFNRHRYSFENPLLKRISILLFIVLDPILYYLFLLKKDRRDAIALYMGYTGSILQFDYMIAKVVKLQGLRSVMYLAGGKAKWSYEKGNSAYRNLFQKTMRLFDEVMVEGEECMELVNKVSPKTRTFYLPNYTETGFAPENFPVKPDDVINFIYFGRIAPTKNVLFIIDIFNELTTKYNNITLTLVGGGQSDYVREVEHKIAKSPYKEYIHMYGRLNHSQLLKIIKNQHIFLFPSNEPCEGHSNALNEAMSWGVIPIVSSINYLPSIVDDDDLVVYGDGVTDYTDIVKRLLENPLIMKSKSLQVYQRVKHNFTQSIIEKRLLKEINDVMK